MGNETLDREILLVPHFGSGRWGRSTRRAPVAHPLTHRLLPRFHRAWSCGGAGFGCPPASGPSAPSRFRADKSPDAARGQRPLPSEDRR